MTLIFDEQNPARERALRQLNEDQIIWIASVRPDGRPHNVPVWFLWHEGKFFTFSEENTQKIRNLRHTPNVVLSLETRNAGEEVAFFDGKAEISAESTEAWLPRVGDAYTAKYREGLKGIGLTLEQMAVKYSQVIVVTPTKVTAW